jgi:hypothetical protein
VRPERALIPLAAVVLAVFGTSRVMESVDPGPLRASSFSDSGGDGKGERRGDGDRKGETKERSRESHSFFSAAGMRELVDFIRSEGGAEVRVSLFRIQANQSQAFVRSGSGGGGMMVIDRGPTMKFRAESPTAVPGGFTLGKLDPRAPARIGDAIARLSDATLADVDYMVFLLNPVTGEGGWDAFLTNGEHTHFHADAHGRHVQRF